MKTLVIIDDELFFRKSICNFLQKHHEEYQMIGEANNGKNGLELINKLSPDIALVDISMPIMDGLEMIKALPDSATTKFIISTGYNDFSYAKQAVHLGVKEYLLKPIEHADLLDCLSKISIAIDKEIRQQNIVSSYYPMKASYERSLSQNFFHTAVMGHCQQEEYNVLKSQTALHSSEHFVVISLKIHDLCNSVWNAPNDRALFHSIVENICTDIISKSYEHFIFVSLSATQQFLILEENDALAYHPRLEKICRKMIHILNDTVHIPVSIFSGTPHSGQNGLKTSYEEALSLQHNYSYRKLSVFEIYDREVNSGISPITPEFCRELLFLIRSHDKNAAIQKISDLFSILKSEHVHIKQSRLAGGVIISTLENYVDECRLEEKGIFPLQKALNTYNGCETLDEMLDLLIDTCSGIMEQCSTGSSDSARLAAKVQQYIAEQFSNPDLRLDMIADRFYVSPKYLCSLFSRETGTTINSCLTSYRMHKAKELLSVTSPSIHNTAMLCGYTDAGYFSKCFKKYYGISPKYFIQLKQEDSSALA